MGIGFGVFKNPCIRQRLCVVIRTICGAIAPFIVCPATNGRGAVGYKNRDNPKTGGVILMHDF